MVGYRIKYIKKNMKTPCILVQGSEFEEVAEAVENYEGFEPNDVCCGRCGAVVVDNPPNFFAFRHNFCKECGAKVLWRGEDR